MGSPTNIYLSALWYKLGTLPMRVLIVDDNSEVRKVIHRYIAAISDEVMELDNGEEALDVYTEFKPDWVLMDFQMGEVNGIEATRLIISKFPEARIVIVTGHNETALRKKAKEAGVSGFVLKENLVVLRDILI